MQNEEFEGISRAEKATHIAAQSRETNPQI